MQGVYEIAHIFEITEDRRPKFSEVIGRHMPNILIPKFVTILNFGHFLYL